MAVTLKEIVITGFEIFQTVGRRGFNDPDDMATIKQLLNGINSTEGGAAGTLNEKDPSRTGPEFDRLVEAIEIFQARHFKGVFAPDGVISPDKKTHKKLQALFFQERDKKGTVLPGLPLLVRPAGALVGVTNETGFSDEGLQKGGNGEWSIRSLVPSPIQMIPVGETRRLLFTLVPGSNVDSSNIGTQILETGIASFVGSEDLAVTIRGDAPGFATLRISAKGRFRDIKLMVRGRRQINLHLTVVGAIMTDGQAIVLRSAIVQQLNRIFQPQSNFLFFEGSARVVTKVRSILRGVDVDIDPSKPLFFDRTNALPQSAARPQLIHAQDLLAIDPSASNQLRLFVGNIQDAAKASILGSAFAGIGKRACWFRADQTGRSAMNSFGTIAHETGHSIGMFHVTAVANSRFLMFPNDTPQDNNLTIPAETTIDLGPP